MRAWLYDTLTTDESLQLDLGGAEGILDRVVPRRSQGTIDVPKPFLIFGLGNSTDQGLEDPTANDAHAEGQFFQVWVHDEGGSYSLIDDLVVKVRKRLTGASHPPSRILVVRYLETSAEFSNETYNTIFRYIRFQAIIAEGRTLA